MKVVWLSLFCLGLIACGESNPQSAGAGVPPPRHPGQDTYNRFCFSCHASGIAGAPRAGDVEAWAPRVAKGQALLLKSTVEGMPPGMPRMGLCAQCTEEQLSAAIDLMTLAK